MRKIYTIGLLAVHIIAHTELSQLLSMPKLLSHYFQHREINPDLGFFTFLEQHYGGDDGTSSDDNLDRKLPFRHQQQNHVGFVVAKIEVAEHVINNYPIPVAAISTYIPQRKASEHVNLYLQPPKAA
ncbi:MAG: hypothetical protein IPP73_13270 [Chitinophagaceae bacterium]|nr:hypothetical protein [Chitinophagaceae bacterium]